MEVEGAGLACMSIVAISRLSGGQRQGSQIASLCEAEKSINKRQTLGSSTGERNKRNKLKADHSSQAPSVKKSLLRVLKKL